MAVHVYSNSDYGNFNTVASNSQYFSIGQQVSYDHVNAQQLYYGTTPVTWSSSALLTECIVLSRGVLKSNFTVV